jgi:phosphopantothenoylcysteine decarboxylase/phosphopantothenate--cysteine ligase
MAIMAAAVADFRVTQQTKGKVKKEQLPEQLEMEPTPDILKHLGQQKKGEQLLVGFALEAEDGKQNAQKKLKSKNLDFIVLNSLQQEEGGFESDLNEVTFLDASGETRQLPLQTKYAVAQEIIKKIVTLIKE